MTPSGSLDPSRQVISRRTVIRTALGGLVVAGLGACGGTSVDEAATSPSATPGIGSRSLAGTPIEVWRDPG